MNYTITIDELETETINDMENVVTTVWYNLSTTNFEGKTITKRFPCVLLGTLDIEGNDISSEIDVSSFINYVDLDIDTVISWVETTETELQTLVTALYQSASGEKDTPALPWE